MYVYVYIYIYVYVYMYILTVLGLWNIQSVHILEEMFSAI